MLRYTAGEDYALDERLVRLRRARLPRPRADAARAAAAVGADLAAIRAGLTALAAEHARGDWHIELADEDGQTALERRLTERIGAAGARIHLGRSRNDQVLTAIRLYLRDAVGTLSAGAAQAAEALEELAAARGAHGAARLHAPAAGDAELGTAVGARVRRRDPRRCAGLNAVLRRIDRSPLGSAAGYGTPGLPIDRRGDAREPRIREPCTSRSPRCSSRAARPRAQLLFEITLLLQDLSRLAADVLLFATQEFGFLALSRAFTTGSSIMPQKRNPDLFELIRGRTASAQACLAEALGICAKLPSGYQRDLQLLKFPLFRGIDLAWRPSRSCPRPSRRSPSAPRRSAWIRRSMPPRKPTASWSTEGIPFREAYRRVAAATQGLESHAAPRTLQAPRRRSAVWRRASQGTVQ